ncbi:histidine utilization protein HutD [Rhodoferax koreense]|uniref:Histidine utilization protein HutD n=1 Tax=Rhodoferax koreensis TaxID=1842727 RepID=A0A1P8JRW2_9BURK|nr:HutD family protein [Rhodoferax koreense]APW36479.1 histidine utilization protein HutD [Rhodoferax koreense]
MLHRFAIADLPATPWKNGGGTTREIVCQPPGAGMDGFDWRVSIATIAAAGPFSAFPGVDRVIMLLDGDGVRLHTPQGLDHRLDTPLVPFPFAGDMALDCDLLGGPSTDFNVMTRRGRLRADVQVLRGAADVVPAEHGLVLAWGGAWQLQADGAALSCAAGTGAWWAWWHGMPQRWRATPQQAGALLVVVKIHE